MRILSALFPDFVVPMAQFQNKLRHRSISYKNLDLLKSFRNSAYLFDPKVHYRVRNLTLDIILRQLNPIQRFHRIPQRIAFIIDSSQLSACSPNWSLSMWVGPFCIHLPQLQTSQVPNRMSQIHLLRSCQKKKTVQDRGPSWHFVTWSVLKARAWTQALYWNGVSCRLAATFHATRLQKSLPSATPERVMSWWQRRRLIFADQHFQ